MEKNLNRFRFCLVLTLVFALCSASSSSYAKTLDNKEQEVSKTLVTPNQSPNEPPPETASAEDKVSLEQDAPEPELEPKFENKPPIETETGKVSKPFYVTAGKIIVWPFVAVAEALLTPITIWLPDRALIVDQETKDKAIDRAIHPRKQSKDKQIEVFFDEVSNENNPDKFHFYRNINRDFKTHKKNLHVRFDELFVLKTNRGKEALEQLGNEFAGYLLAISDLTSKSKEGVPTESISFLVKKAVDTHEQAILHAHKMQWSLKDRNEYIGKIIDDVAFLGEDNLIGTKAANVVNSLMKSRIFRSAVVAGLLWALQVPAQGGYMASLIFVGLDSETEKNDFIKGLVEEYIVDNRAVRFVTSTASGIAAKHIWRRLNIYHWLLRHGDPKIPVDQLLKDHYFKAIAKQGYNLTQYPNNYDNWILNVLEEVTQAPLCHTLLQPTPEPQA